MIGNNIYISGLPHSGTELLKLYFGDTKLSNVQIFDNEIIDVAKIKSENPDSIHIICIRELSSQYLYMRSKNLSYRVEDYLADEKIRGSLLNLKNTLIDFPTNNQGGVVYLEFENIQNVLPIVTGLYNKYIDIEKFPLNTNLEETFLKTSAELEAPKYKSPQIDSFIYSAIRKDWWWYYAIFYADR